MSIFFNLNLFSLGLLLGAALFATGSVALAAYVGPPGSPTTCPTGYQGCDAPLNVSGTTQTKAGNLIFQNTAPTLYLQDTDHRSAMLHTNSNYFYVLRGSGANSTTWESTGGYWPLVLNLENNAATLGGTLTTASYVDTTDVYLRNIGKWASQLQSTGSENRFGGKYIVMANGPNTCAVTNPYTGACSCPAWAPNARSSAPYGVLSSSGTSGYLYYCYKP